MCGSEISWESSVAGLERGRGGEREVVRGELREGRVGGNRSYEALGVTAVTLSELGSNVNDPRLNTPESVILSPEPPRESSILPSFSAISRLLPRSQGSSPLL